MYTTPVAADRAADVRRKPHIMPTAARTFRTYAEENLDVLSADPAREGLLELGDVRPHRRHEARLDGPHDVLPLQLADVGHRERDGALGAASTGGVGLAGDGAHRW